ncbi:MAG TPA: prolyl oligopeptidase family serine peptidase [Steroidobacteraceae bacterium]|jgi:dipeptidyl aminopeptidase/acylaminoacyl peptidase
MGSKICGFLLGISLSIPCLSTYAAAHAGEFSIAQVLSAPFAASLSAAPDRPAFAWVSNQAGHRNVWLVQKGDAGYRASALTHYDADDGQEISEIAFVPGRNELLYVRGGDVEYPDKPAPNPAGFAAGVTQDIFSVDFDGGAPRRLASGHTPVVSPDGKHILYLKDGVVFEVTRDPSAKPEPLFKLRGAVSALRFSPAGDALAFVSDRGDHSFVGIYRWDKPVVTWLDPSVSYDQEPRWSSDGRRVAFLRVPSTHDDLEIRSHRTGFPWSIRVVDVASNTAHTAYTASKGAGSVFHPLSSDAQLVWSGDSLVFPAENDGWLHLYSVSAAGGTARLLTPGAFEIEYASASADGRSIVYAGNAEDIDRRHLWRLEVATGRLTALTHGGGIETQPAWLHDGSVAYLAADVQVPAHAAVIAGAKSEDFLAEGLAADFPRGRLLTPASVRLPERAGVAAHGILFTPNDKGGAPHPAVIFMHGGPVRQMLLGWHYMDYYSNAYAENQYLASKGYVVLALNYRGGIGYGLDFREPANQGASGASEYNDVLAAADFLKGRPDVDPKRIGLWGGSYGGNLTALGLARNSDIFKAGVDLHGVHDWHHWYLEQRDGHPLYILDAGAEAQAEALAASPISSIGHWRSPVLLIQGDDDHNVAFSETVRLAQALREQGVPYEDLVFPDELHGFLRHVSWLRAYEATADFLDRKL